MLRLQLYSESCGMNAGTLQTQIIYTAVVKKTSSSTVIITPPSAIIGFLRRPGHSSATRAMQVLAPLTKDAHSRGVGHCRGWVLRSPTAPGTIGTRDSAVGGSWATPEDQHQSWDDRRGSSATTMSSSASAISSPELTAFNLLFPRCSSPVTVKKPSDRGSRRRNVASLRA